MSLAITVLMMLGSTRRCGVAGVVKQWLGTIIFSAGKVQANFIKKIGVGPGKSLRLPDA